MAKTGIVVALAMVSVSLGHLMDQPARTPGGAWAFYLSFAGVALLLFAVLLDVWKSDA
ncbi:MAG: hypothetical protein ACLQIQ_20540 [Beijerinckiaceae bacterium]